MKVVPELYKDYLKQVISITSILPHISVNNQKNRVKFAEDMLKKTPSSFKKNYSVMNPIFFQTNVANCTSEKLKKQS